MASIIHRLTRATARSISAKYSLLFALLVIVTVTVVLVSAGTITFSQSEAVRYQVQEAVANAQAMNEERELRRTGSYLSHRLQGPLVRLDIKKLNEQIDEVSTWLPVASFLILDKQGRIITDGTAANTRRLEQTGLPSNFQFGSSVSSAQPGGRELSFVIGESGRVYGYAKVLLAGSMATKALETLDLRISEVWNYYSAFLIGIGAIALSLVLSLTVMLTFVLSRSLARPLHEMIEAARKYASGNLDVELSVRSNDELGRLAQSLNKMAADMKKTGTMLKKAQEIANLGSWEWDRRTRQPNWSPQALKILGYSSSREQPKLIGLLKRIVRHDRRPILQLLKPHVSVQPFNLDIGFRRTDGDLRLLRIHGQPLDEQAADFITWTGTLQDVTEKKAAEENLNYLANYDTLTGLPNRHMFHHRLQEAISRAAQHRSRLAVIFLDLDRFKAINDALGHSVGDDVLKLAAMRLRQTIRDTDMVARLGGDEFTIILENIVDHQNVVTIAQRIVEALSEGFALAGERDLCTSCSVGITLYPDDGTDVTALLQNADVAMYRSKAEGRGLYRFYTPDMNREAHERLTLENQLRSAIRKKEFALHFQPQLSLATGKLAGVEALLRWRTEFGLIPPGKFIPILEDSGMIQDLSGWVLENACRQIRSWHDMGLPKLRIAVNLSARQLQQPDLTGMIHDILRQTMLSPEYLEIEITESVLLDPGTINPTARELADMGVRLSIDDFGTGYCALNYLKQLSVDVIKIDRSFIRDIPKDQDDRAISEAIINLSKSLGLQVIAEGVETREQWEYLRRQGCDLMQGFLASKALPSDEFVLWTKTQCRQVADSHYWNFSLRAENDDSPSRLLASSPPLSAAG